jgi:polar amino acid transport system substrate-binding protein
MARTTTGGLFVAGTVVIALSLSACSGASGTQATGSASSAGGGVSVPADALLQAGQITYCSDLSSPPLESYDASQNPVGAEVDLGNALAQAMGVKAVWANTAFSGIVPALQAKQCDAILSELFIKPAREKVVDFVPYMYNSNTVMVQAATTDVTGLNGLCGKKVAAETGTTVTGFLTDATSKCPVRQADVRHLG